ncbi:MAG: T9SS type A sorting domain-containing protein [Crocinitomicaceae bacterium]|nr:T9SS type A sorting domain-containing protein [Crocinitomicaceae bacterium]
MAKTILILVICLTANLLNAQTTAYLKINHKLGAEDFALDYEVQNNLGNIFKYTRFQYYLTKFSIVHDGNQVTTIDDSVVSLVNAADGPYTLVDLGEVNITNVEAMVFHVGVHQPVNNADPTLQPVNSPLAPQIPSMHWGWASGYRFAAIEGLGGSAFTLTFEIHALGNENYYTTMVVPQSTNLSNDSLYINVNADYLEAVRNIDVSNGLYAHGNIGGAKVCLENFNNYVFGQTFVGVENEFTDASVSVYPVPSDNNTVTVEMENLPGNFNLEVYNADGALVNLISDSDSNKIQIQFENAGMYSVRIIYGNQIINKKVIIL